MNGVREGDEAGKALGVLPGEKVVPVGREGLEPFQKRAAFSDAALSQHTPPEDGIPDSKKRMQHFSSWPCGVC